MHPSTDRNAYWIQIRNIKEVYDAIYTANKFEVKLNGFIMTYKDYATMCFDPDSNRYLTISPDMTNRFLFNMPILLVRDAQIP